MGAWGSRAASRLANPEACARYICAGTRNTRNMYFCEEYSRREESVFSCENAKTWRHHSYLETASDRRCCSRPRLKSFEIYHWNRRQFLGFPVKLTMREFYIRVEAFCISVYVHDNTHPATFIFHEKIFKFYMNKM